MSHRFFCEQVTDAGQAVLEGPEAHHLAHVMRLSAGEELVLFDGRGHEFVARIRQVGRQRVDLDVLSRREVDRELGFEVQLAVALPKGDRQRWLVEKSVELGVTRLVPLQTQRGVAQPTSGALERLQRSVIEASKQCGRNRLMIVSEPVRLADLGQQAVPELRRFIAHPGSESRPASEALTISSSSSASSGLLFAIGPEGGFSEEEITDAVAAGWQAVELGPRILRVETAALALATLAAFRPAIEA